MFVCKVTGLKEGFRPPFPFEGVWLYHNDKAIVHVVKYSDASAENGRGSTQSFAARVVDHLAFEGEDYDVLTAELKKLKIAYTEHIVPLTKEHQVFVEGPDGLKLEIVFPSE